MPTESSLAVRHHVNLAIKFRYPQLRTPSLRFYLLYENRKAAGTSSASVDVARMQRDDKGKPNQYGGRLTRAGAARGCSFPRGRGDEGNSRRNV